jgi:hypothetical protein
MTISVKEKREIFVQGLVRTSPGIYGADPAGNEYARERAGRAFPSHTEVLARVITVTYGELSVQYRVNGSQIEGKSLYLGQDTWEPSLTFAILPDGALAYDPRSCWAKFAPELRDLLADPSETVEVED